MEIYTALALELSGKGKTLIPVVHETTQAGPFLAQYQWISFLPGRNFQMAVNELIAAIQLGHSRTKEVEQGRKIRIGPPLDLGELPATDHFVGRDDELLWMQDRLRTHSGTQTGVAAIAATNGLAGVGKSTLAAMAARRLFVAGTFPDGIAVVRCHGLRDPVDVLQRIIARFDSLEQAPAETDLTLLGAQLQRTLEGKQSLVVLDNVEPDWPVWEVTQRIREARLALLITSRQELPTVAIPREASRLLELLSEQQALELFGATYGITSSAEFSDEQWSNARRIVHALGRHTLAVILASTSLAREPRDWKAVANEYESNIGIALDLKDNISEDEVAQARAAVAVGQMLRESVSSLPERARRMLIAWGAIATPDFGRQAALAAATRLVNSDRDRRAALSEIVGWRLAETWVNSQMPNGSDLERVRLHPLVHACAREALMSWEPDQQHLAQVSVAIWYEEYGSKLEWNVAAVDVDDDNIRGAQDWADLNGKVDLFERLRAGRLTSLMELAQQGLEAVIREREEAIQGQDYDLATKLYARELQLHDQIAQLDNQEAGHKDDVQLTPEKHDH
jgi:hypothetical protein